jgi:threonine synthase
VSSGALSRLVCAGCGAGATDPYPFRCPNADGGDDDIDHVLTRLIDAETLSFPRGEHPNPFIRYREMLHSYHLARTGGVSDDQYRELVGMLDGSIAVVDGGGFGVTPFVALDGLASKLGFHTGVWVKDETGNVSGSHKARHLMGVALSLEVAERTGRTTREESDRRGLAIASCGNAALAAAVLARAAERPLSVFIPPDADRTVVEKLDWLGARISVCERTEGEKGDPCYLAFRRALAGGAIPFCCQGPDNGLTIEGGETLVYEMISTLIAERVQLDRLFVQVGGGALASACVQGLREAGSFGLIESPPRIHAVQTKGAFPLRRAYEQVRSRILRRLGVDAPESKTSITEDEARAEMIRRHTGAAEVQEELDYARTHRSEFMWPWEKTPKSIAHGILDDETYDWFEVVRGMIESGGYPVTVPERLLTRAHSLARATTDIRVDPTGAAGLAGLMELCDHVLPLTRETVAVLFTGIER